MRLRWLPDSSAVLPWRRSRTKLHGAQGCSLRFHFWPTGVPVSEGYPALAGRRDSRPGWMVAAVRSLATPTSPRPGPGDHSGFPSLPGNAAPAALNSELVIGPDTPATQIDKLLNGGRIRDTSPMPVFRGPRSRKDKQASPNNTYGGPLVDLLADWFPLTRRVPCSSQAVPQSLPAPGGHRS